MCVVCFLLMYLLGHSNDSDLASQDDIDLQVAEEDLMYAIYFFY